MHQSSASTTHDYSSILNEWIRITSEMHEPLEKKLPKLLRLSRLFLKTDVAIIAHIKGGTYEVHCVDSPNMGIEQGQQFELALTYCEKTIRSSHVTSFHQACNDSLWSCHPAYKNFKLESYIGIPLHLEDGLFGTLGFSSTNCRSRPFTTREHDYVQMTARWIEQALEGQKRDSKRRQEVVYLQQSSQKAREEVMRTARLQQSLLERITQELRFPLQGLATMSQELIGPGSTLTNAKDRLRTINETSKHLLSLLDELPTANTLQPHHCTPPRSDFFSPHDMIEDISSLLLTAAKSRDIVIDLCLDATLPEEVSGDLSRHRQILTNLLSHSIQSFEQGHLAIHVSMAHSQENKSLDDDIYAMIIEIEDEAPDIPSSIRPLVQPEAIDRSFARSKPQLAALEAHGPDSLLDEDGVQSVPLEIALHLLHTLEGKIECTRRTDLSGNLIRVKLPIRLTAASFESAHTELERCHIWTDTRHDPLRRAITEACERFGCRLVETLSEAHICLIDHALEDLEGRLATYQQLAPTEAYFHLMSQHPPEHLPAPLMGHIDRTIRHRQLLALIHEKTHQSSPTQELTLSTINMLLLEDDPEAFLALHPSTDPLLSSPQRKAATTSFEATSRDRSHANLADLSRRISDLGSSALLFPSSSSSLEEDPLEPGSNEDDLHAHEAPTVVFDEPSIDLDSSLEDLALLADEKLVERTTVGVPGSISFTTPVLFDRSVRERHESDDQALRLYDTLLQEFFVHSARWLTEIRDCTNARIMQQRLNQDLLEIKETAREIGLMAISQICFQMIKGLKDQTLTRFAMLNQLDKLSSCMNRSFDETKGPLIPPPTHTSSYMH